MVALLQSSPARDGGDESPRAGPAAVACESVASGYFGSKVLEDVSFVLDTPAIYVVLGPNGAGKTTLFRTLAGILRPLHGEVRIHGLPHDHPDARTRMHYLSHVDGLPDGLRVREVLSFYARVEGAGEPDIDRVLGLLEIRDLADRFLAQLSAGQKKRVAVARVFLRERDIYLMDEPTSNLDPKAAREIRALLLKLSHRKVVLYSSHNLFEAREIGQYVLVLRNGRLVLFDRLENLRASRFVVGVRVLGPVGTLDGFELQGEYFVRELPGPEAVPGLIQDLEARGVKIRELREMGNPLEELFG